MAFLDNSGDIILDAVLTDTGRMRLAKGDGSFRIVKFALGDDEINYELFNKDHASGSAYYDLEVMQTPVLEAFTDNAASMKSKLVSIPRNNLLYLPVVKLNEGGGTGNTTRDSTRGTFIIAADATAQTAFSNLDGAFTERLLQLESTIFAATKAWTLPRFRHLEPLILYCLRQCIKLTSIIDWEA